MLAHFMKAFALAVVVGVGQLAFGRSVSAAIGVGLLVLVLLLVGWGAAFAWSLHREFGHNPNPDGLTLDALELRQTLSASGLHAALLIGVMVILLAHLPTTPTILMTAAFAIVGLLWSLYRSYIEIEDEPERIRLWLYASLSMVVVSVLALAGIRTLVPADLQLFAWVPDMLRFGARSSIVEYYGLVGSFIAVMWVSANAVSRRLVPAAT